MKYVILFLLFVGLGMVVIPIGDTIAGVGGMCIGLALALAYFVGGGRR
jgi:hypothetical protein